MMTEYVPAYLYSLTSSSNVVQWKLRGVGNLCAKEGETLYAASVNSDLIVNWHKLQGCSGNSHNVLFSMGKSWRAWAALRFWNVNSLLDRVNMTLKKLLVITNFGRKNANTVGEKIYSKAVDAS